MRTIVLASTSHYRRAQLLAAGIEVQCAAPDVDESALADETPEQLAPRLARAKAIAVAARFPDALVIGADQIAVCGARILGKPGSAERQRAQLQVSAGKELRFLTAVCILDAAAAREFAHLDITRCRMRDLSPDAIARYVAAEPAFDCAGGFKVEGRGILLFDAISSEDPSALIGLPLIGVRRGLQELGCHLP